MTRHSPRGHAYNDAMRWTTWCMAVLLTASAATAQAPAHEGAAQAPTPGPPAEVPAMTDAQRAQLDTADDASARLDEAALYPLLENVMQWPGDEPIDAAEPDYAAIRDDPAAARGEVFQLEGRFAGRPRRITLARPGPWGDALTEWAIVVRREPMEHAVVYFVDPQGQLEANAPRAQTQVRVVGRFYKLWRDENPHGQPVMFMTFVARSAEVVRGSPATPGTPQGMGGDTAFVLMLFLIAAALVVLWRLRSMMKASPAPRRRRRAEEHGDVDDPAPPGDGHDDDVADADATLPEAPDKALEELSRRRGSGEER